MCDLRTALHKDQNRLTTGRVDGGVECGPILKTLIALTGSSLGEDGSLGVQNFLTLHRGVLSRLQLLALVGASIVSWNGTSCSRNQASGTTGSGVAADIARRTADLAWDLDVLLSKES